MTEASELVNYIAEGLFKHNADAKPGDTVNSSHGEPMHSSAFILSMSQDQIVYGRRNYPGQNVTMIYTVKKLMHWGKPGYTTSTLILDSSLINNPAEN